MRLSYVEKIQGDRGVGILTIKDEWFDATINFAHSPGCFMELVNYLGKIEIDVICNYANLVYRGKKFSSFVESLQKWEYEVHYLGDGSVRRLVINGKKYKVPASTADTLASMGYTVKIWCDSNGNLMVREVESEVGERFNRDKLLSLLRRFT